MNTLEASKAQKLAEKQVRTVPKPKIKASSGRFGYLQHTEECIYEIKEGTLVEDVTSELEHCILDVSNFLEIKRDNLFNGKVSLSHPEINLLLARLDTAAGLCLSASNTLIELELDGAPKGS